MFMPQYADRSTTSRLFSIHMMPSTDEHSLRPTTYYLGSLVPRHSSRAHDFNIVCDMYHHPLPITSTFYQPNMPHLPL
jgi:hypothetical protein